MSNYFLKTKSKIPTQFLVGYFLLTSYFTKKMNPPPKKLLQKIKVML